MDIRPLAILRRSVDPLSPSHKKHKSGSAQLVSGAYVEPEQAMAAPPAQADDRHLMFRAGIGDTDAFAQLYRKYQPMVADFLISRSTPDDPRADLTQEVFHRAWKGANRFRGESTIKTYLFAIAIRVLQEYRFRPRSFAPVEIVETAQACPYGWRSCPATTEAEVQACRRELERKVADRVASLPAGLRRAIELTVYRRLEVPQAAQAAGCSPAAFRKRLGRAIKRLRSSLHDHKP